MKLYAMICVATRNPKKGDCPAAGGSKGFHMWYPRSHVHEVKAEDKR
jgi:hypothetical protein